MICINCGGTVWRVKMGKAWCVNCYYELKNNR